MPVNLKAGVTKPSRYEPSINRTYQDLNDYYSRVVLPRRIVGPCDKAKVEVAERIVARFLPGKLRNQCFFSLVELNVAICDGVAAIKAKVLRKVGNCPPNCRRRRIARHSLRCQKRPTVTPIGCAPVAPPIITSSSPATTSEPPTS